MKPSHFNTPRTLDDSTFYYVGYRRSEEGYYAIDSIVYLALFAVLFGFLLGYFS